MNRHSRGLLLEAVAKAPSDMARFGLTAKTIDKAGLLGFGSNGSAFLLPDGKRVLKRTRDRDEGGMALRLLEEGPVDGLPEVFYVGKIPTNIRHEYLIVMELACPANPELPCPVVPSAAAVKEMRKVSDMILGRIEVDDTHPFVRDLASAVRFVMKDPSLTPTDALYIASDEMDVHADNIGLVRRHGRDMMVIVDLGQADTMEHAGVPMASNPESPLVVYTGTQVWEGRPEIRETRKGRAEHGPGLYFTTKLQTARKYAKGRGTVLRVELSPDLTWLEEKKVPLGWVFDWVTKRRGLRHRSEIIADLVRNAERTGALRPGKEMIYAYVLVNLMVNYDALAGSHGPALAEFLVWLGIDASHVSQSGEDWIVLFNPEKVLSWRRVGPEDVEDLPRVRRRSSAETTEG